MKRRGGAAKTKGQKLDFPKSFCFGVATAAYQVEGAAREGGRGPSVWDTFSHMAGRTANGDTGDVATDHYHRFRGDVQVMQKMGVEAYRFSFSWSRILPNGTGRANPQGLAFYDRLIDNLLAKGIEPWATLFHWDLPQALQDRYGGWLSKRVADDFADYASLVGRHFGDRVRNFFTINEFYCFIDKGYNSGRENDAFAPGMKVSGKKLHQARHHACLAHGQAVLALRASARKAPRVGLAENAYIACPLLENGPDVAAAKRATRRMNAPFLTALLEGEYLPEHLQELGRDAPSFTSAEMKIIGTPLDFVGLNLYTAGGLIQACARSPGYRVLPFSSTHPKFGMPWLNFWPSVIYWGARQLKEIWKVKNIYITENGCAAEESAKVSGEVFDTSRVVYLREHLRHAARALREGYPLRGYFCWSLLDNFEWACGYAKRFGLVHVNYRSLQRTPKVSSQFYSSLIRTRKIG